MIERAERQPLLVGATGIDGAGKSTSLRLAAQQLSETFNIVAVGHPTYSIINGNKKFHYTRWTEWIDRIHEHADQTTNPRLVGIANSFKIAFMGRVIEPNLINRLRPDAVFGFRDYYLDPIAYSALYAGAFSKLNVDQQYNLLQYVTQQPYRNILVYLTLHPYTAVKRIDDRITIERTTGQSQVDKKTKWPHMHENIEGLTMLDSRFKVLVEDFRDRAPDVQILQIDTQNNSRDQVVNNIVHVVRNSLDCWHCSDE